MFIISCPNYNSSAKLFSAIYKINRRVFLTQFSINLYTYAYILGPIPKQNSLNQYVTSGPETVKITSITGLPPRLASNKANSIKTGTPAKVTAEVCLVSCLTSFRKGVCSQNSHEISLPLCGIYLPHLKRIVLKRFKKCE